MRELLRCRPEGRPTLENESFAFNGGSRSYLPHRALRKSASMITTVRRNEVARLYGVSESLFEDLSPTK